MTETRKITESAVMIALAVVLSFVTVYRLPNGGAVTAASMVPIIIIALKSSFGWGMLTAFVYSLIQMCIGFYPPPVQNFVSFALVVLLDYVIAFGCIGFSGVIARAFGSRKLLGAGIAAAAVSFMRFLCHFASGILIWSDYAPQGQPVWLYSLTYNGSYMLAEGIINVIAAVLLYKVLLKRSTN